MIERQGRAFVLYAGLLDEAHQKGLKAIRTRLVQAPCPENGETTICLAEVEMEDGRVFSGIGDATPHNVGRNIAPHAIRMAECVPLSSEILTRSGWRFYDELTIGEPVLAYDPETDRCRWTPLEDVRVYREPVQTVRLRSRSFDAVCTPDHSWAVAGATGHRRRRTYRALRQAQQLARGSSIIVAAPAEGGDSPLTPREAALLGWLATDGTIDDRVVRYRGRPYGPYRRATINQSKQHYVAEIRALVGGDGQEHVARARTRDFGTYVSECLPQHKFDLTAAFTRDLLAKAGWAAWTDLPQIVLSLTQPARAAMLHAMLKGDGARRGAARWVFGQKAKPGVSEAFTLLATLEGCALGRPRVASRGDVPVQSMRVNRLATVAYLRMEPSEPVPVWCPTTALGTWVMRQDGYVTITGNTRSKARALRDAINVATVALEELGDDDLDAPPDGRALDRRESAPLGPRTVASGASAPTPISARERAAATREEKVARPAAATAERPAANGSADRGDLATPAQVRAIYLIARDQHHLTEGAVDERSVSLYGSVPAELTRRQASSLITQLKGEAQPAAS
jgi:hypothetical protein